MKDRPSALLDRLKQAAFRLCHEPAGRQLLLALALVALVSWFYAFLASAGTFETLLSRPGYYDRMAEGFRAGHLYIVEQPKPELLAKTDPWAHENYKQDLWLWDASLFGGHYYMYWGPVPALLLLAWQTLTGDPSYVTDQWPTVVYMAGRLLFGALLLLGIANATRVRPPTWLVLLSIAVFGLSGPIPFTVARPRIYETALAAGQCFLFAGLWLSFKGLTQSRHRPALYLAASALWGLAFASRVTTVLAVPFIIVATVYFSWQKQRSLREGLKTTLLLSLPLVVIVILHGVYNYARFDSPFEFGIRFQVTLRPYTQQARHVVANIYTYLFAPMNWSLNFPFATGQTNRLLPWFLDCPRGYKTFEKVSGVLTMGGFGWLGLLHLAWLLPRRLGRQHAESDGGTRESPLVYRWARLCAVGAIVPLTASLGIWEASMRYSGDAIGGIVLAAALAAFLLVRQSPRTRAGALWRVIVVLLGLHSCFVGAFSAFSSYGDPFRRHNPVLYRKLERALSLTP